MLSKIWIINIILAIFITVSWVGIWRIRQSGVPPIPDISECSIPDAVAEKPRVSEKKLPEPSEYEVIVEKNLFSPDRMAHITAPQESQVVAQELKISGEKVMLYGVVMVDDYKSALINNPSKGSNGKEYRWVKEGEKIDNLKVADIQATHILLNDNELQYKILLFDAKKSQKKETAIQPTKAPEVIQSSREGSPENIKVSSEPAIKKQSAEQPKAVSETPTPKGNGKASEDADYEMIDTPFGMVKRKINK
jgi:hypothetical protein